MRPRRGRILPLNCTTAIDEWEELADPIAAAALLADDVLERLTKSRDPVIGGEGRCVHLE